MAYPVIDICEPVDFESKVSSSWSDVLVDLVDQVYIPLEEAIFQQLAGTDIAGIFRRGVAA